MKAWLTSWRLALRLARRDLLKHRARAIIALVMVTLPVLGVVAADILIQTADVSPAEGINRTIGTAATAEVRIVGGDFGVVQGANPINFAQEGVELQRPTTVADIERVIGRRAMLPAPTESNLRVRTTHGLEPVTVQQVDATAPLARGLYRLASGRWPTSADEVVVNQALRDRGVGETLQAIGRDRTESPRTIVGTVVDATRRSAPVVVGKPGSFPAAEFGLDGSMGEAWLVDGPPITWSQVQQLNALGVLVTDRQIASHPGDYPNPVDGGSGVDDTTVQVAALIVVMALIEVVLLAGPAFAVGARKQQRSLALMVAAGGTPSQARRVIVAGGVLLGLSAAVVGVIGGIGAAWLLKPAAQRFNAEWLGPFDVPWPHLAAVAAFGLVSALIACLVPAWIASRQHVVAVLAGRRGDAKPVRAFPVVGVALFLIGVVMAFAGAHYRVDLTVAWSAVVCVLGMVLLVPVVVSAIARVAGRLPLPVRFAARDAVRHRTRTTPAVAAVAATVAGVVALGISTSSDEKENREVYTPSLVMGNAVVSPSCDYVDEDQCGAIDWDEVSAVLRQRVPAVRMVPVVGIEPTSSAVAWYDLSFRDPAGRGDDADVESSGSWSGIGTDVVVSDGRELPPTVSASFRSDEDVPAVLASGRAVVFTDDPAQTRLKRLVLQVDSSDEDGNITRQSSITIPATVLYRSPESHTPVRAVLPPVLAKQVGAPTATIALELDHPQLSRPAERDVAAALDTLPMPAAITMERGYQAEAYTVILQWVLALLAAVLMLGGTLTAMFLALSDARPDLATLAAVGAAPRTRRSVAAAYTFVVAFVGAVLGMVVGFVPGLAITWPLTAEAYTGGHGPYIDIPWLLIAGVVLGLPLLTAAIVGVCTRSRLPMVSRLT
jgi:putative ABC transport system permease protein